METWVIIAIVIALLLFLALGTLAGASVLDNSGNSYSANSCAPSTNSCGVPKANSCSTVKECSGGARGNNGKLVLFYTTWCGYCQQIKPAWNKLQKAYPNWVVSVDGDTKGALKNKFGVRGYPSIYWCPKGLKHPEVAEDYTGERNYNSLLNFLNSKRV